MKNAPTPINAKYLAAALDEETERCPHCSSQDVEHVAGENTGDWSCEMERWRCNECTRFYVLEYVLERSFRGIRLDDKRSRLYSAESLPELLQQQQQREAETK